MITSTCNDIQRNVALAVVVLSACTCYYNYLDNSNCRELDTVALRYTPTPFFICGSFCDSLILQFNCASVWSLICVKILRAVYSIPSPCSNSNSNIKCQQSNANSKGTYTHTTHTVKTLQFQVSVPIKIPIFNVFLVNNFQNLIVFIGHTHIPHAHSKTLLGNIRNIV